MKILIRLILFCAVLVNGKKVFRHGNKLEAEKKLESFMAMMKSSTPEESLGNSKCDGQPAYVEFEHDCLLIRILLTNYLYRT